MADLKPKSRPSRAIRDQGPCSRRPMRVEISKNIRWQGVVVPKFFDAYRCGGDCKFPLDKKVSSLKQFIYWSGGLKTTAPCL